MTPDWTEDAACARVSDDEKEYFFSSNSEKISKAKEICAECPVRRMCLETALERHERWGVWGGVDSEELRRDMAVGLDGMLNVFPRGPIRCPECGPWSTKYLYIVEKKRTNTKVGCMNCGLRWTTKKLISKNQSNW